jgi:hypothetical protein
VKIGYSKPRATRGLHPSGFRAITVWRPKDLLALDPKLHVGRIAHTVGENKRVQIVDEAKKANIRILNPGLKRPAEVVPEVTPEVTPVPAPTEPSPETGGEQKETRVTEKKEPELAQEKPKKAKAKTTKKRKSKK